MRRFSFLPCLLGLPVFLLGLPAAAQEPVVRAALDEVEAIPGQAVSLRLTLLAPTFLPEPPVWPSYEAPNLLVRVASSGPVSERIDGATWAGVSRRYLITPMLPGKVLLPASEIIVTWSDPNGGGLRQTSLHTKALTITGRVPDGAEGLQPFIAATEVALEQTFEGAPEDMAPGDSVTRSVTATIEGASPMFLPPLLPTHAIEGVRAYPATPVLEETENRGVVRGTRTERVTLAAEAGGAGKAPAVSLSWYNLQTGTVETAELPAVSISVVGPRSGSTGSETHDWRTIGFILFAGALLLVLLASVLRRAAPTLGSWASRLCARWFRSEVMAWFQLRRTVAARDHSALRAAIDRWTSRLPGADPRGDPRLYSALTTLGAARYGPEGAKVGNEWRALIPTLTELRQEALRRRRSPKLPPLNARCGLFPGK